MSALLEVSDASKSYGAVRALDGVSLTVDGGEIVALLGDNGAGKSTLVKAIGGVHRLDAGEIRVDGAPAAMRSPVDARRHGIETLHQDLALFDNLSALANFFIGRERRRLRWLGRLGLLDTRAMTREWDERLARLEVRIPGAQRDVGVLSGGQRQASRGLRQPPGDPRRADRGARRARVAPGARPRAPAPGERRRGPADLAQPRARGAGRRPRRRAQAGPARW
jgi:ABC-type sugar transport system ATPase subunit